MTAKTALQKLGRIEQSEMEKLKEKEAYWVQFGCIPVGGLGRANDFYNETIALKNNLPRAATEDFWRRIGRVVLSGRAPIYVCAGATFFGVEHTYFNGGKRDTAKLPPGVYSAQITNMDFNEAEARIGLAMLVKGTDAGRTVMVHDSIEVEFLDKEAAKKLWLDGNWLDAPQVPPATEEPKAPLPDWGKAKPFDPFKGWECEVQYEEACSPLGVGEGPAVLTDSAYNLTTAAHAPCALTTSTDLDRRWIMFPQASDPFLQSLEPALSDPEHPEHQQALAAEAVYRDDYMPAAGVREAPAPTMPVRLNEAPPRSKPAENRFGDPISPYDLNQRD